jgi:hypothetical protein
MEKTRFYQLTKSELELLNNCLCQFDDVLNTNIDDLKNEIKQQIDIYECRKKEFELKKIIRNTESKIEYLQKELDDYKKLLNQ